MIWGVREYVQSGRENVRVYVYQGEKKVVEGRRGRTSSDAHFIIIA